MITLTDAREYLRNPNDPAANTQIVRFINAASAVIEDYCNRPIRERQVLKYFAGRGEQCYELPHAPVIAISSIESRSDIFTAWAIIPPADYTMELLENGKSAILYQAGFQSGTEYRVTYLVGFAYDINVSSGVPEEIQQVCREMIFTAWEESPHGKSRLGMVSVGENVTGAASMTTTFKDLLPRWEHILSPLRKSTC